MVKDNQKEMQQAVNDLFDVAGLDHYISNINELKRVFTSHCIQNNILTNHITDTLYVIDQTAVFITKAHQMWKHKEL